MCWRIIQSVSVIFYALKFEHIVKYWHQCLGISYIIHHINNFYTSVFFDFVPIFETFWVELYVFSQTRLLRCSLLCRLTYQQFLCQEWLDNLKL